MVYLFVLLAYGLVFYATTPSWGAFLVALAWGGFFFSNQLFYRAMPLPTEAHHHRTRVNFALLASKEAFVGALLPISFMALAKHTQHIGLLGQLNAPWWLNIIIGVLAFDYMAYAVHVLMHKIPFLRGIHAVHHSDTQLDASSVLRLHPMESLLRAGLNSIMLVALGLSPLAVLAANSIRVIAA
jgi:sterol desaturase/sphingolipid hydroxylase (fatty acid hydroxylase superfamily)